MPHATNTSITAYLYTWLSDISATIARDHVHDMPTRTVIRRELTVALDDDGSFEAWLTRVVPLEDAPMVREADQEFLERSPRTAGRVYPEVEVHTADGRAFVAIHVEGAL
jgi:hypothetical protein